MLRVDLSVRRFKSVRKSLIFSIGKGKEGEGIQQTDWEEKIRAKACQTEWAAYDASPSLGWATPPSWSLFLCRSAASDV